ncbi:hypothetical protein NW762_005081 [Fusarium torreyae]|uniref:Uncharacterized protein n=1 Tax=Fusarium torreyae TaxID=1237075 RepID=A0A9W8S4T1_9HYPO|nr:hypothetical protein NW762_005081 [Fusarium torreyae]
MAPQYLDLESLILRESQHFDFPYCPDSSGEFMTDQDLILLENCRAFVGSPDAEFDVVTRIDSSGQWYGCVLKSEGGRRTLILENKATKPERALELLHEASARVVDQYVTCHGYDLPPSATSTSKTPTGMRGGLVKPDVIACGSSDSEAFASDSDESVFPTRRSAHRRGHRSGREAAEATNMRPDRTEAHSASDSDEPSYRRTSPWGVNLPQRPAATQTHNPPQTWNNPMPAPVPVPSHIPGSRRAPSMIPPLPRNVSIAPHAMGSKMYPALLNINWPGNGKKNMLVQVAPALHCLQSIATNEANMRPLSFASPSAPPYYGLPGGRGNATYRATVRRVTLGEDETYEMSAFGNDLTALFRSTPIIPKFEIEVITVPVPPGFPVIPPPRPTSAASSASSRDIAD